MATVPDLDPEERALAARGEAIVARAVASDEARASHALRLAVDAAIADASRVPAGRARRLAWRPRVALVGGTLAAALAALVLAVGPGGDDAATGPALADVVRIAAAGGTGPAPAIVPASVRTADPVLAASVDGVAFPDWSREFAWTADASGARDVDGRRVGTVDYVNRRGVRATYAIVSGDALPPPTGGTTTVRAGTSFTVLRGDGRTTVVWEEGGRTCVLVAPSTVATDTLVDLAASRV